MTYNIRSNEPSIESRARKPTKGIRARLRTHLRQCGVQGKFRTDERRKNNALVIIGDIVPINVVEFEGRPVIWLK